MRLTPKQWKVLEAIIEYKEEHQVAPTVRELCRIVGLTSTSTMHGYLERLRAAGVIEWDPAKPRTIRVKIPS